MSDKSGSPWRARLSEPAREQIVVADPDASVFVMVRQLTAPDRFEVTYADTPDELMLLLRGGFVELAVVNVAMLDASPESAKELTRRSRRGLKVVVTNDVHSETSERRARAVSPVHYSPKPMSIMVFKDVVGSALRTTA